MWIVSSRRAVALGLVASWTSSSLLSPSAAPGLWLETTQNNKNFLVPPSLKSPTKNIDDDDDDDRLADWICHFTPSDLRAAIQETGHFLYRGGEEEEEVTEKNNEELHETVFSLQQPAPDLLFPETYDNDPMALAYFQCLEKRLNQYYYDDAAAAAAASTVLPNPSIFGAKPSTGHIATSNPQEAGKWGPVVSVWPLGDQWSYVWPRDRETFYEDAGGPSSNKNAAGCREGHLIVSRDLVKALQQPAREVLFASSGYSSLEERSSSTTDRSGDGGATLPMNIRRGQKKPAFLLSWPMELAPSSFLAIPQDRDGRLRQKLAARNYGL